MKKTYRTSKLYTFIILPLFFILTMGLTIFAAYDFYISQETESIIMVIVLIITNYIMLKTSYKIEIDENLISFYSLLGKKDVNPIDIVKMTESVFYLKIKSKNETLIVPLLIDNFGQLKNTIKSLNTNIKFKNA